jgi:predicted ATPase with chaperone activity
MAGSTILETAGGKEANYTDRYFPAEPRTHLDLDVPHNLLVDLMLKITMLEGVTSIARLGDIMKIDGRISDKVFQHLRKEQLVEVKGMQGNDYELGLTATGRKVAQDRYAISQYVGPVPVPLDRYTEAVREQGVRHRITREYLQKVFYDLVLTDETLDQLGPAIISNSQIFLYGSTGNGKTSIAERLVRIFEDTVFLPYAIEVQGQIINFYDSVVHQPMEPVEGMDRRWVRCERPCIAVGGEMVQEMLELRYEETLKANNGLFIIDDFGRQMINPRDLLNRWIVPLDRGIDFLSLRTGVKFPIPFETMVVFSTNLDPRQLADEAFLRRIQNKVKVETISPEIFDRILQRICEAAGIEWSLEASDYVRQKCSVDARKPVLRACYPRDIVSILQNIAKYENREPTLNHEDVDRAAELYFAR